MDAVGIAIAVNLSGGTVTRAAKGISDFAEGKVLADSLHPGRFLQYMNLDYAGFDRPEFSAEAVKQVEEGSRLGASGFKEFKRLGLSLRDGQKKLITIDDPKLDAMWTRLGQLGMPVSIHVADPRAFWLPYDDKNERWTELKDHRSWWFGDPKANNAEDLEWVEASLDRHPNMMADLAARIPETGRHDPAKVRRLFEKHQDRILFATDFQV